MKRNHEGLGNLGQISIKAYRYPDDSKYLPGCWAAWIEGRTDHMVSIVDNGEERSRANHLNTGMAFLKITHAAWTLAGLTSQSKIEREAAKADVREWIETGKAVYAALMAAIDQAKAK